MNKAIRMKIPLLVHVCSGGAKRHQLKGKEEEQHRWSGGQTRDLSGDIIVLLYRRKDVYLGWCETRFRTLGKTGDGHP